MKSGQSLQFVDTNDTRSEEERRKDLLTKVEDANNEFQGSFFRKRPFVPKPLFDQVSEFYGRLMGTVNEAVHASQRAQRNDSARDVFDVFDDATDRIDGELSDLFKAVAEAFQNQLGVGHTEH